MWPERVGYRTDAFETTRQSAQIGRVRALAIVGAAFAAGESGVSGDRGSGINRLLDDLPRKDLRRALERCESVDLVLGATLCETDEPLRHVYFPVTGFISLVTKVNGHKPLELGLIGNEGMLGVTAVLGVESAPQRAGAGCRHRLEDEQTATRSGITQESPFEALAQSISLRLGGAAFSKHCMQSLPRGRGTIGALAINDPRPGPRRSISSYSRISGRHARRASERSHDRRGRPPAPAPNPVCPWRNPHS